ncbi:MAG TPA: dTMP kinase [Kofleriaceae bacterium]|nr:dTMP kinase [Kofleriaceae bacterium]
MSRGPLIVLEGIDGAGTTTQSRRLVDRLTGAGFSAHLTREPSDGPVGRLIREMLAGDHAPVSPQTMSLLFAADRADHIAREVDPALAAGTVVVSDRWVHSSLAYQGTAEDRAWIRQLNARALIPAVTVFLEVAPEVAARRRAEAGRDHELYDDLAVQRKVAAGYREVINELSPTQRIVVIDGDRDPDAVAGDVWRATHDIVGS